MTLDELLDKLKNLKYRTSDGYELDVINKNEFNRVEQLIRQYVLDNHDSEYGELQGKLWAYEQIIQKSNFAPFVVNSESKTVYITPECITSNHQ